MAVCLSVWLPPVPAIEQPEQCKLPQQLKLLLPAPLATNQRWRKMIQMLLAG